jgi:ATP-dependent RNA helicase SUPV3L1/SUV3
MNHEGCPCSLLTGEEATEVPGATHVSSTIEMADYYTPIDVAVVDEAQMIADNDRGHRWTAAILGIPATEVHVCCAPHAQHVIEQLVRLCGDDVQVVCQERLVPLAADRGSYRLPQSVQPGDALIVFSRRSVHAVATEVSRQGLKPSMVYGALPHDVRHEEARRFDAGETDVVVATDAIGMGMNLPIRSVVFVEQEKFDGRTTRTLRPEEVQQIAGRAGRFGRYDKGLYHSTRLRKDIVQRYRKPVPVISSIPVGIPANIALVRDATLSDSVRQWMEIEQPAPFTRISVTRDLRLICDVEKRVSDDLRTSTNTKLLVLSLASMPFDERDDRLFAAWHRMVDAELAGQELTLAPPDAPRPNVKLAQLEADYRYCDLLYTYARTFGHDSQLAPLVTRRNQISHTIMGLLAQPQAEES